MSKPWFRTKEFGYGAGLPISWEGWVVFAAFVVAMIGVDHVPMVLATAPSWLNPVLRVGLIVGFVFIAWRKSDRPWGMRWGGK